MAEARFYHIDTSQMVLLQIEEYFDKLQDLTDPSTMFRELARWNLIPKGARIHTGDLLLELASQSRGGNHWTDALGKAAHLEGWNGVKFANARTLSAVSPLPSYKTVKEALEGFPFSDEALEFSRVLNEITQTLSNIVLFRGTYVAANVRRYRYKVDESWSEWLENPSWGAAEDDLAGSLIPQEGSCTQWEKTIWRSYMAFLESAFVIGPSYNRHVMHDLLTELPSAALPTRQLQFDLSIAMPLMGYRPGITEDAVKKEMCRRLNSLGPGAGADRDLIQRLACDLDGCVGEQYSAPVITIRNSEPVGLIKPCGYAVQTSKFSVSFLTT